MTSVRFRHFAPYNSTHVVQRALTFRSRNRPLCSASKPVRVYLRVHRVGEHGAPQYDFRTSVVYPIPPDAPCVAVAKTDARTQAPWCVLCRRRQVWHGRRQVRCRHKAVGSRSSMATLGGWSAASLAPRVSQASRGCNKRIGEKSSAS